MHFMCSLLSNRELGFPIHFTWEEMQKIWHESPLQWYVICLYELQVSLEI